MLELTSSTIVSLFITINFWNPLDIPDLFFMLTSPQSPCWFLKSTESKRSILFDTYNLALLCNVASLISIGCITFLSEYLSHPDKKNKSNNIKNIIFFKIENIS